MFGCSTIIIFVHFEEIVEGGFLMRVERRRRAQGKTYEDSE